MDADDYIYIGLGLVVPRCSGDICAQLYMPVLLGALSLSAIPPYVCVSCSKVLQCSIILHGLSNALQVTLKSSSHSILQNSVNHQIFERTSAQCWPRLTNERSDNSQKEKEG